MGGSAFNEVLNPNSFPRLPPLVYQGIKTRIKPTIETLYTHVGVPAEAPEKTSHGDIDFVVACPIAHKGVNEAGESAPGVVPAEVIKNAIGASHVSPMEGYRTSNFAIPVARGEWAEYGHGEDEEAARKAVESGEIYYQVDVNVNPDKAHWERIMFFHAYGDLNLMLGLLARNVGLRLGEKGLKYPDGRNPPIILSESFVEILPFMGLSMDRWNTGFSTKVEVFEWVTTSRFFNASHFRLRGDGISKVKGDRKLYGEFVEWVEERQRGTPSAGDDSTPVVAVKVTKEEALQYFKKAEDHAAALHSRNQKEKLKKVWSGHNVNEWAGMNQYWKGVKLVMDTVRARMGGDEGVLKVIDEKGEEEIRKVVLEVREELFIIAVEQGEQRFVARTSVPQPENGEQGSSKTES